MKVNIAYLQLDLDVPLLCHLLTTEQWMKYFQTGQFMLLIANKLRELSAVISVDFSFSLDLHFIVSISAIWTFPGVCRSHMMNLAGDSLSQTRLHQRNILWHSG